MNHYISARLLAVFGGIGSVAIVWIADAERQVIRRIWIAVAYKISTFRGFAISLKVLGADWHATQSDFVRFQYFAVVQQIHLTIGFVNLD